MGQKEDFLTQTQPRVSSTGEPKAGCLGSCVKSKHQGGEPCLGGFLCGEAVWLEENDNLGAKTLEFYSQLWEGSGACGLERGS